MTWRILAIGLLAASSACSPIKAYPDFCPSMGRALTEKEKIEAALSFLSNDKMLEDVRHFRAFVSAERSANPLKSGPELATEYYQRYPDCCEVVEPLAIRIQKADARWFASDDAAHGLWEQSTSDYRWTKDVLVSRYFPFRLDSFRYADELGISDCGKVRRLGRG